MKKSHLCLRAKARVGPLLLAQKIERIIFYLLILFLPTQFGRHFWPYFTNLYGIRIDYLSPTLYFTDLLIIFLIILSIIKSLGQLKNKPPISSVRQAQDKYLQSQKERNVFVLPNFFKNKFLISYFIVLISLSISILLSKNPPAGFYGLLKLAELTFLGFYISKTISKVTLKTISLLFSAGIIFESFLAIFQFFNKGSLNGIFYFLGERLFNSQTPGIANASLNGELVLRPYGTFSHPNVLAGYLAIGMTLIIFNFSRRLREKLKILNFKLVLLLTSLILGTSVLVLTMSRIALVLWLMILVFCFIHKFINHKSYILILLAGLLILGLATPLGTRFTKVSLADESIVQRKTLIQSSLAMTKNNPIFGVGLNNFLINLPHYQKQNNPFFYLQPVHNIYLLILSETGVIGLGFFIWFLVKTYKRIKNKHRPLIHNSLFIILSSVLILGMFDHYFLTLQQGQLLFSLVLGLCWSKAIDRL